MKKQFLQPYQNCCGRSELNGLRNATKRFDADLCSKADHPLVRATAHEKRERRIDERVEREDESHHHATQALQHCQVPETQLPTSEPVTFAIFWGPKKRKRVSGYTPASGPLLAGDDDLPRHQRCEKEHHHGVGLWKFLMCIGRRIHSGAGQDGRT